jgi:hypothetical protein
MLMTQNMDLDALQAILDRLDQLVARDYEFLKTYWDQAKPCFFANELAKRTVSVTSTCFCVFALLQDASLLMRFEDPANGGVAPPALSKLIVTLRDAEWNSEKLGLNNIYTTPIVVACLARLKSQAPLPENQKAALFGDPPNAKVHTGIKAIVANLKANRGPACFKKYYPSAYLTFWSFDALNRALTAGLVHDHHKPACEQAMKAMSTWALVEMHRQIALFAANDFSSFDAMQLGYSLVISMQSTGDGDDLNMSIAAKALEVIFASQATDGLWPKGLPIFHYVTRGSVYVFGFELLDILLEHVPAEYLRPHLGPLAKALQWAEINLNANGLTKGWRSNNLGFPGGAEAWSTAAVILFLRFFARLVNKYRHDQVLGEFRATRIAVPNDSRLDPTNFYDGDVPVGGDVKSLKGILKQYLIEPHKAGGNEEARKYSAVFYGPPGTAKTTLAEAIAYSLGWPYIYLQTSDFSRDGFEAITGRARTIFAKLGMLSSAVILFDEVEEFVRDRDKENLPPASKMITTSMLSLIQELRRRKNVLFIVTTNFLKNFDSAITRPGGRFDILLLVPPPSLAEKKRMFEVKLLAHGTLRAQAAAHVQVFNGFVDGHHDPIEYFTFSEWSSFTEEAVKRIAGLRDGGDVAHVLQDLLEERKDGITIRGNLRDDYGKSKTMVRIW